MTDAIVIAIYAVFGSFSIVLTTVLIMQKSEAKLTRLYVLLSICTQGWIAFSIIYRLTTDPSFSIYVSNLPFIFISFMPVFLLLFIIRFYKPNAVLSKKLVVALFIIPAITTVFSAIPSLNWLIRTNYSSISVASLHAFDFTWNGWFYVHHAYSYSLMLFSVAYTLMNHKKQPSGYNFTSKLIVLAILFVIFLNQINLALPFSGIDYTLIGICFASLVLYIAVINKPSSVYLNAARDAFYTLMNNPVFILDKQNTVLNMNNEARRLLEMIGFGAAGAQFTFDEIMDGIKKYGGSIKDDFGGNTNTSMIIYLNEDGIVYKASSQSVVDKKGQNMGSYVEMVDITQLIKIMEDVERSAQTDWLTGLANRQAFEEKCMALDSPENLPISFIVGDINGLKYINDHMGHYQGDLLIKSIAKAIQNACPKDGLAARVGGDEFMMVIPNCSELDGNLLMQKVSERVKAEETGAFQRASIALGLTTKVHPGQIIGELLKEADKKMYSQKQYDRRR